MERKNEYKKNFKFSFKKIKKIWLPIILTILIVLNIPFIPNSLGTNDNFNFQPSSGSGESYFFSASHFKNKNAQNRDGNIAFWILFLIICIIIAIVYFILNKVDKQTEEKIVDNTDYIELLKDDSDIEGNI